MDAQKYLDKFLKYSFALPNEIVARPEEERTLVSIEYFKQLIRNSRIVNGLQGLIGQRIILNFISNMMGQNNISLREAERLVRFLEIYHSSSHGLGGVIWQCALLHIAGVLIFCLHPNLIGDINKNCTEARGFARLFNIQSLPDTPKNNYLFNRVDIITVMLVMYSKIEDKRSISREFYGSDSGDQVNEDFLQNLEICPRGIDGVFSILKDTSRVLSSEQTPQ